MKKLCAVPATLYKLLDLVEILALDPALVAPEQGAVSRSRPATASDQRTADLLKRVQGAALELAGVTANKNMVPFDPRKPMVTSGVRLGTPAVTTRGMSEKEMVKASSFITRALEGYRDESALRAVREDVEKLCRRFPLYADRWSEQD